MTKGGDFTNNEKIYLSVLVVLFGALALYVNAKTLNKKDEVKK